jgi:integral membrane protein (TIGR01906 family)
MNGTGIESPKEGESPGITPSMSHPGIRGVVATVALPLVIVGNALLVLLIPWHADLQYATPGFPDPPAGLSSKERGGLARDGIVSIWPVGPGATVLEDVRLRSGGPAFEADEVSHMSDVRFVVQVALSLWAAATIGLVIVSVSIGLNRLRRSLRAGAWLTLGAFVAIGLLTLLSFDQLFTAFHEVLFEDGTWTFPTDSTLLGLYPERFWINATGALVLLSALQALSVIWWSGRSRMPR